MGRPRKVGKGSNIFQEGKPSNPSAPAIGEENSHSHTNINSTIKETTDVETKVDLKSNVSATIKITSQDSSTLARRSVRLKRKAEPLVYFNLVEYKAKAPKMQVSKSPNPGEISSEQEVPPHDNSNNMETMNAETTVHLDSNGSRPRKKTSEVTALSGSIKTKKEPVGRSSLVERKNKPSKGKQVSTLPSPTEKNFVERKNKPSKGMQVSTLPSPTEKNFVERKNKPSKGKQVSTLPSTTEKNFVERKNKPSKGKQVSTLPSPTEKNFEQEAPSHVHQAVDERNLVEKVDYIAQENTSPNDSTSADADYRRLYLESERRVEELMEHNIDMGKELNFALGKIEAYEKMMGTMGFVLQLSPQRGIPWPTNTAAPDTSNHHQNVSSPKVKPPTKSGRYKNEAKA